VSEHRKGQGVGWIHFAGTFYLIAAAFNLIVGIAGLTRADHFDESKFVVSNLQTWSYVFVVVAAVQAIAGVVVLLRRRGGRVPAIVIAVIGMVAWFVAWAVFPLWGIVMMVLYGLIIYALTAFREYFA
jgi:hypothetical protein